MNRCGAELCPNWTGDGCICVILGLDVTDGRGALLGILPVDNEDEEGQPWPSITDR